MRVLATCFALSCLLVCVSFGEDKEKPKIAEVEIFVSVDCPIANGYLPLLNRMHEEYESQGVRFLLVYPEVGLTKEELESHRQEYGIKIEETTDPLHVHVQRAGSTVTPEAVVYDKDGKRAYRGQIDNLYTDFGDRRKVATIHYLKDVLDALIQGGKVPHADTKPVGCFIEPLESK